MRRTLALATIAAITTLLAACSKVTAENYNKIELGQSYEQVQELIGKPTSCDDVLGARNCVWGKAGSARVNVTFVGNKVVLFSAQNLR